MKKLLLILPLLLSGCSTGESEKPYACVKVYYLNGSDWFYAKDASEKDGILLLIDLHDRPIIIKGYTGYSMERRGGDKSSVTSH